MAVCIKKHKNCGCDFIATGHYAKIEYDEKYKQNVLKKANATEKDQSYVLYNLPKNLLDKVKFPLGNFESKDEIRKLAKEHNLPVANKPDSEDICFIPDGNYKKFIEENSNIKPKPGNIVTKDGKILGVHTGLYKYTIGQRKGLGISYLRPLYVIGFNPIKNELIVGEEDQLYKKEFMVSNCNFLVCDKIEEPLNVQVKTRYSAKCYDAKIIQKEDKVKVIFDNPQKSITPGQSAVFYDGDIVIGGGKIIE